MEAILPILFLPGINGGEVLILFIAVLVLFGPKRLPEIVRTIGRTVAQLRKASGEFKEQIMKMDSEPEPEPEPEPQTPQVPEAQAEIPPKQEPADVPPQEGDKRDLAG